MNFGVTVNLAFQFAFILVFFIYFENVSKESEVICDTRSFYSFHTTFFLCIYALITLYFSMTNKLLYHLSKALARFRRQKLKAIPSEISSV